METDPLREMALPRRQRSRAILGLRIALWLSPSGAVYLAQLGWPWIARVLDPLSTLLVLLGFWLVFAAAAGLFDSLFSSEPARCARERFTYIIWFVTSQLVFLPLVYIAVSILILMARLVGI